jgi:26S proteasome regulatory subunit N7
MIDVQPACNELSCNSRFHPQLGLAVSPSSSLTTLSSPPRARRPPQSRPSSKCARLLSPPSRSHTPSSHHPFIHPTPQYTANPNPELKTKLHDLFIKNSASKLYRSISPSPSPAFLSETELSTLDAANAIALTALTEEIEVIKTTAGETEAIDGFENLTEHHSKIGDSANALVSLNEILALPKTSTNKKIEAGMSVCRVKLMAGDWVGYGEEAEKLYTAATNGGDWDKLNRLKIYHSLSLLHNRKLSTASPLLLSCLQTFACEELIGFDQLVLYSVISGFMGGLSRGDFKKKIVENPEVLSVTREIPALKDLVDSYYATDYRKYMGAIVRVVDEVLAKDWLLHKHKNWIARELVILGYNQYLTSYKSVTLDSMSTTFGVSGKFLDGHLSTFISSQRLHCKIDAVAGVVETLREDEVNKGYRKVLERGDEVLNNVQKLTRIIDL